MSLVWWWRFPSQAMPAAGGGRGGLPRTIRWGGGSGLSCCRWCARCKRGLCARPLPCMVGERWTGSLPSERGDADGRSGVDDAAVAPLASYQTPGGTDIH